MDATSRLMHDLEQLGAGLNEQLDEIKQFNERMRHRRDAGATPEQLRALASDYYARHPMRLGLRDAHQLVDRLVKTGNYYELAADVIATCRKVLALSEQVLISTAIAAGVEE